MQPTAANRTPFVLAVQALLNDDAEQWTDETQPRTERPVRFLYVKVPFPGVRAASVAVRFRH